jgi:hypothetical protein
MPSRRSRRISHKHVLIKSMSIIIREMERWENNVIAISKIKARYLCMKISVYLNIIQVSGLHNKILLVKSNLLNDFFAP